MKTKNVKKSIILMAVVALFTTSCNPEFKDIKVSAENEEGLDMSKYETYAWLGSAQIIHDELGQWDPPGEMDADLEIRSMITKQMNKHKLKINETNPDLLIGYAAGIDLNVVEANENVKTGSIDFKQTPKGALIISIMDAKTGNIIWLGVADADVRVKPKANRAKRRLQYAVKEMFKLLPK